jgi:HK97 gp10 family phage protein
MIKLVNRTGKLYRQLKENQEQTLHKVGVFCVDKMKQYVAVDTGELQGNCEYVVNRNELFLQNKTPYAIHQEYGTYKMKAHPFFRPSVYNHKSEIKSLFESGFRNGI